MDPRVHNAPDRLAILTLNCALLNLRWLGIPVYRPTPWTEPRLEYLIRALSNCHADLIFLQECFHYRQKSRITNQLATLYPYTTLESDRFFSTRLGSELLILSRYPLLTPICHRFKYASPEEKLFTRLGFLTVDVDLPGTGCLQLVNFHLTAGGLFGHPEDPAMESIRASQIDQMLDQCNMHGPVILAGDLNAGPEASAGNYRAVLKAGFRDSLAILGVRDFSWHPQNPLVRRGNESHLPAQRIDHIFVNDQVMNVWHPTTAAITMKDTFGSNRGEKLTISDHYGVEIVFKHVSEQVQ